MQGAAPRLASWIALRLGAGLRSELGVDDVMAEVTLRAWSNRGQFDGTKGSFTGWCLGIARKVLGEALARLARGGPTPGPNHTTSLWERVPDSATRATRQVALAEFIQSFAAFARELEEQDQRLLLYRGLERWPHERVAQRLGISENAAQKRWVSLQGRLREHPQVLELVSG